MCDHCVLKLRKEVRRRDTQRRDAAAEAKRERKSLKQQWMHARKKRLLHAKHSIEREVLRLNGAEAGGDGELAPGAEGGGAATAAAAADDPAARDGDAPPALVRSSLAAYPLSCSPSLPSSLGGAALRASFSLSLQTFRFRWNINIL